MPKPVIFLNYRIDPARRARHLAALGGSGRASGFELTDEQFPGASRDVRIIVNKTRELSEAALAPFPNLAGICLSTSEDWMLTFDRTRPVKVRRVEIDRGTDVAEVAVMLMLRGLKRPVTSSPTRLLPSLRRLVRRLRPPPATETMGGHNWMAASTLTAYRRKVGIAGYGLIGREIHRRIAGFGVDVLYSGTQRFSAAIEGRLGISYRDLGGLFQECDVIFLQLPLTRATTGLVGAAELALAKPHLVLVNCGRAAVADKQSLYRALRDGRIAYYGADVFWREPMPLLDPYRFLSNACITPHLSESVVGRTPFDSHVAKALDLLIGDLS